MKELFLIIIIINLIIQCINDWLNKMSLDESRFKAYITDIQLWPIKLYIWWCHFLICAILPTYKLINYISFATCVKMITPTSGVQSNTGLWFLSLGFYPQRVKIRTDSEMSQQSLGINLQNRLGTGEFSSLPLISHAP